MCASARTTHVSLGDKPNAAPADFDSGGGTNSDAAYDGLHPNALGEYQLAQAFSQTLVSAFSLGRSPLVIPRDIPPRLLPTPTNFSADSVPSGIVVTWDAVYGAFGYDLQLCSAGQHDWTSVHVDCNRYDWQRLRKRQAVRCRVRTSGGDKVKSPWSSIASAVANPETAPPPVNIVTHATPTGFTITWDPPPPPFSGEIDRFGIGYFDGDQLGAFPCIVGARGNSAEIKGLIPGHRHYTSMETWTTIGGGIPTAARAVVVGMGTPSAPAHVHAEALDRHTVELSWLEVPGAAGYDLWLQFEKSIRGSLEMPEDPKQIPMQRPIVRSEDPKDPGVLRITLPNIVPSVWEWEYAVTAYNGNDTSVMSEWVTPAPLTPEKVSLAEDDSIQIEVRHG